MRADNDVFSSEAGLNFGVDSGLGDSRILIQVLQRNSMKPRYEITKNYLEDDLADSGVVAQGIAGDSALSTDGGGRGFTLLTSTSARAREGDWGETWGRGRRGELTPGKG